MTVETAESCDVLVFSEVPLQESHSTNTNNYEKLASSADYYRRTQLLTPVVISSKAIKSRR